MGYRAYHKDKNKYEIVEIKHYVYENKNHTEEVLIKVVDMDNQNVSKVTRHFNNGGGFGGWTPDFFLIPFTTVVN